MAGILLARSKRSRIAKGCAVGSLLRCSTFHDIAGGVLHERPVHKPIMTYNPVRDRDPCPRLCC